MRDETNILPLTLCEVAADPGGAFFAVSPDFADGWWDSIDLDPESEHCFSAVVGDQEVARILARERDSGPDPEEWCIPVFGETVQIEFFEVAGSARRRGLGTAVIEQFAGRYPGKWLMAFSEGADEFWGSLGWVRYPHPSDPFRQSLFIRRPDGS